MKTPPSFFLEQKILGLMIILVHPTPPCPLAPTHTEHILLSSASALASGGDQLPFQGDQLFQAYVALSQKAQQCWHVQGHLSAPGSARRLPPVFSPKGLGWNAERDPRPGPLSWVLNKRKGKVVSKCSSPLLGCHPLCKRCLTCCGFNGKQLIAPKV